jgi:hypothetical protein
MVGAEEVIEQVREVSADECVFPKLEWRFDGKRFVERQWSGGSKLRG